MTQFNEEAFNRKTERYEKKWKAYLNYTHDIFLDKIETTKGDTVLDASSGTGLLAAEMIEYGIPFKELVLNDPFEGMLAFARSRLEGYPEISFHNHTAGNLDFRDQQFDRIISLNAFHFYIDQEKVLENFSKILKPGGSLHILDWNRSGFSGL